MKGFYTALNIEFLKAGKSKMLWITIIFFVFISAMMGFLLLVAKHPEIAKNSEIISTKASFMGKTDWPSYFGLLIQLGMALAFVGAGIVTVWVFGREYSDRTIKDILALPVSRFSIVTAKFLIAIIWSFLLLVIMFFVSVLSGLIINLDGWSAKLFTHSLVLFSKSSLLTLILLTPVAFVTCVSRGYLLPFGFIILTMIVTQFIIIGLKFISPYFPWAIPALITGVAGPSNPQANVISWIILWGTVLLGFIGTFTWWRYADQH
jgi:ABC-2 type transport system permease protein